VVTRLKNDRIPNSGGFLDLLHSFMGHGDFHHHFKKNLEANPTKSHKIQGFPKKYPRNKSQIPTDLRKRVAEAEETVRGCWRSGSCPTRGWYQGVIHNK